MVKVSVVIPVYNPSERIICDCLSALEVQTLPRDDYEIIAVTDGGLAAASWSKNFGVRILRQEHKGAPAARNKGWRAASGEWIAFTDHDCIPSRNWLSTLLNAVERSKGEALGAAGPIFGFESNSPAARFVDLTDGLGSERLLSHPLFPFAPSGNLMYRRQALLSIGGFDERYLNYDACDLHTRLRQACAGDFYFEPHAVVLHRHRANWKSYWSQQRNYGRGMGQFFLGHREMLEWSLRREFFAWINVMVLALGACVPSRDDRGLIRRGSFLRQLGLRMGFMDTYWNWAERKRW